MKSFKSLVNELSSNSKQLDESFVAGIPDAPTAKQLGIQYQAAFAHHPSVQAELDKEEDDESEE